MNNSRKLFSSVIILVIFSCFIYSCTSEVDSEIKNDDSTSSHKFAVASGHEIATNIGAEVLKNGGNAFDAAVAVHFALAVVYPQAGNIAGGGFMVYRLNDGETGSLDFREKAPLLSSRDMFLDENGDYDKNIARKGVMSVGVPGSVAGMFDMHNKFGLLPWSELLKPAIALAMNGFELTERGAQTINSYMELIDDENQWDHPYKNKSEWMKGDHLKNPDLSTTLKIISENGKSGFYSGEIADLIVSESQKGGGILSSVDLMSYETIWRSTVEKDIGEYKVISMGPPSSGGIASCQLLKGAEGKVGLYAHNSDTAIHLMCEIMKRVYADRAEWLGDMDFVEVPVDELISDAYLNTRFGMINAQDITSSSEIGEGNVDLIESFETTHYSIVDNDGNAVSITTTLNGNFGSKVIVKGGGFFLNNEMDDFSSKPGTPNQFGLIGGEANSIEPEKRMLSSMSPTIVEKNGELYMVIGTPGGSTIITNVYQVIQNVIDYDMSLQDAVNAPKIHHQWLPDKIHVEKGRLDSITITKLQSRGYDVEEVGSIGKLNAILVDENGFITAAADTLRGDNHAVFSNENVDH